MVTKQRDTYPLLAVIGSGYGELVNAPCCSGHTLRAFNAGIREAAASTARHALAARQSVMADGLNRPLSRSQRA
jgi:hypothetical protein